MTMKYSPMRFSIRNLLLVTVIVALALGWWVDHWRQATKAESLSKAVMLADERFKWLKETLENRGIDVNWDWKENDERDVDERHFSVFMPPALPTSQAPALNPPKD